MPDEHKNFAYSTVATPPSPGATGSTLVVAAGDGAKFPTPPFNVTIWPIGTIPLTTNAEVARVTGIATDTLTFANASGTRTPQEGSNARTIIAGDQISAAITAKTLQDVEDSLRYDGDFVAGNYLDGDIVVSNGIAYLCTKATSVAPTAWPGGIAPAVQPLVVSYGTTLPASPTDGMEAILVDSVTNPSYQWRFRYNAGSTSPYKWEFVGGAKAKVLIAASVAAATGWNAIAPTFTFPRAGDYECSSYGMFSGYSTNCLMGVNMYIGGALNGPNGSCAQHVWGQGGYTSAEITDRLQSGLAAGTQMQLGYYLGAGTGNLSDRYIAVRPVRVA